MNTDTKPRITISVTITAAAAGAGETVITQTFEAENQNPEAMQRRGWQGILNSFKQYAEAQ